MCLINYDAILLSRRSDGVSMNRYFKPNLVTISIFLALNCSAAIAAETVPMLPETEASKTAEQDDIDINREQIINTPVNNTDLSQLLKRQTSVGIDDGLSSLRGGDLAPEEISLADARPHQTQYMIGGVSTNNISTYGQKPDSGSLSSGHTSGYFVDTNLMGNVEVMEHNIDAQYGGFTGGVINVDLRQPTDELVIDYQYRMTDSDWNSSPKRSERDSSFEDATYGDGRYQPNYQKRFHSLHVSGAVDEHNKLAVNVSRKDSDIPLKQNGVEKNFGQSIDNLFLTHIYTQGQWQLSSDLRYSNFTEKNFLNDSLQNNAAQTDSESTSEHQGMGATVKLQGDFEYGRWLTTLAYDQLQDKRSSELNYFRTNIDLVNGVRENTGGYGNLEQTQDSWQLKSMFEFEPVYWGDIRHELLVGAEAQWTKATGKRKHEFNALSYNHRTTSEKIAVWNQYSAGEYQADTHSMALFFTDKLRWQQLELSLGGRLSNSDMFDETVFAPRVTASWDFDNQSTNRITLGASRYYSSGLLGWALLNDASRLHVAYQNCISATGNYSSNNLDDYQCASSKPSAPVDLNNAVTPYSDELSVLWSVDVGNFSINPSYVYRQQRQGLSFSNGTLENNIKSDSHIYGLNITNIDRWQLAGGALSTSLEVTYTDRTGAGNLTATYDAVNDFDQGYEDQWVLLDGELMNSSEMDTSAYNSPWKANFSTQMYWDQLGLTWNNIVQYESGLKSTMYVGFNNAEVDGETIRVKELISEDMESSITWDTSVRWQPEALLKRHAAIEVSVTNLLDDSPKVTTYGSSRMPYTAYHKGREVWLTFSLRN